MRKLIFSAAIIGFMLGSCGTSRESTNIMIDTTLSTRNNSDSTLPYQDADRTRGSVSPGAEEENSNRFPEKPLPDSLAKKVENIKSDH
jgi:hypothetical protein